MMNEMKIEWKKKERDVFNKKNERMRKRMKEMKWVLINKWMKFKNDGRKKRIKELNEKKKRRMMNDEWVLPIIWPW